MPTAPLNGPFRFHFPSTKAFHYGVTGLFQTRRPCRFQYETRINLLNDSEVKPTPRWLHFLLVDIEPTLVWWPSVDTTTRGRARQIKR